MPPFAISVLSLPFEAMPSYDEDAAVCEADQMLEDWKADILALGDTPVDSEHAINAEGALKKKRRPGKKGQKAMMDKTKTKKGRPGKKEKELLQLKQKEIADNAIATYKASRAGRKWLLDNSKEMLADWKAQQLLMQMQMQVAFVHTKLYKAGFPQEWRDLLLEFLRVTHLNKAKTQIKQCNLRKEG